MRWAMPITRHVWMGRFDDVIESILLPNIHIQTSTSQMRIWSYWSVKKMSCNVSHHVMTSLNISNFLFWQVLMFLKISKLRTCKNEFEIKSTQFVRSGTPDYCKDIPVIIPKWHMFRNNYAKSISQVFKTWSHGKQCNTKYYSHDTPMKSVRSGRHFRLKMTP